MILYGLIGKSLSHSFSASYFNNKFKNENINAEYRLFELTELSDMFQLFKEHKNLKGLNITIPFKESILSYLDYSNSIVKETGSCNTLKIKNQKIYGFNTDVYGFEKTLEKQLQTKPQHSLVFGNGGAAKSILYVLKKKGILATVFNRSQNPNTLPYSQLNQEIIQKSELIINTTPVGMFPHLNDVLPFPFEYITSQHIVIDLIYNPEETLFLKECRKRGAKIVNGLLMLQQQAEMSWEIWNS